MRELKIGDYIEYYDWHQIGKIRKAIFKGIQSSKAFSPVCIKVQDIGSNYTRVIYAGQLVNLNVTIPELEEAE